MTKVLLGGKEIGSVEQVQGGHWFAESLDDHVTWTSRQSLGAYRSMSAARQAVIDHHQGREPVGQIKPTLIVGPSAGGMDS